jgi:DNA-binding MarR family transcriptional regulator
MNQKAHSSSTAVMKDDSVPSEPYCIESSMGYRMRRVVTSLTVAVEREMVPLGITDAQWKPLLRLLLESGTSTVAGLARSCSLDAGAMTRLLDRLEAKSLCRRVRSKEDRRVVELELTSEGNAIAEQIPAILTRLHSVATSGMTADEVTLLMDLLARMLANLQEMDASGNPIHSSSISHSSVSLEGAAS